MGGHKRKGQSQRTKNNMKPSNSGRIAELVDNRGFQFSSFSTLNDSHLASSSSHVPNVPVLSFEMFGSDVDPNFHVVLKKMNKKDATTRFKALQELKDLCNSSTPEVLNQVLPVWARIYCLLAVDVEHRVREAVQEVHKLIVNKVGRNLAPYLKQIVPLWFISQYDTYAPAASVASIAFKEVFSSRKMVEVISFCQAEILGYIKENILNLTTQSLSKGDLNKDEMEAKYERIIISSLNGYALYLSKVPSEQIEKFKIINLEIISSTKFWKFSKFKTPSVRSAWFTLLSSLCQYGVFLLLNEKKQVANSVIGGIDDNDSGVLSVVWEAALHSFSLIQDFWLYVNLEKFFLPKFCNILKHGGKGNANFIYPNILLLLNSIPTDVIREKHQFFDMIFSSFQEGMKLPIVFQSPSGSDAVASSFIECIQFLIKLNIEDRAFCMFLIEQHVFKVLSVYMLQAFYHYQLKSFVRSSSHMLIYWYKNKDSQIIYGALLQKFWTDILSLSIDNFKNSTLDKDQLSVVLNSQFLIISILNSPHMLFKKNLKVSFLDDLNELIIDNSNVKDTSYCKTSSERKLEEDMILFVKELFQCYYTFCLEVENKILKILVLSQMNKMIELLNVRLSSCILCLQPRWGSSLLMWLKDTDILMEHLLGIMFSSLEFLDLDEQSQLLLELTKERSKECLQDAIKLASHSKNVKLKQWLHSEDMKIEICRTYDEINNYDNETILETVKHFLDLNNNGEFIIGITTVLWLIDKIEKQLLSHCEIDLKKGTEMVSTLFCNIASAKQTRHEDLVLRMLESLFIGIIQGYGKIVYKTWEKGMEFIAASNIDDSSLKEHIKKLSVHLTTYVSDRDTQFDIKLIHRSVTNFVVILTKNISRKMSDFGVMFIEILLSSVCSSFLKELQRQIETICSYGDIINGKLCSDIYLEDNELNLIKGKWNPLLEINILAYARSIDFVLKILSSVFGVETDEEENEDDIDKLLSFPSISCEVKNIFTTYIVHLAYSLSLLKKFKNYYCNTRQYFDIKNFIEPCGRLLKEIVQRCDQSQQKEILKTFISNNQSPSNELWCDAKELILDYLEGTLQDGTINALPLHNDDAEISGLILEINEIHKLRRMVESNCLSSFILNEKLKIIAEKYKESFSALNNTSFMGIAKNFLLMTAEVAWLFKIIIATQPTVISVTAWDFARISVTKWLSCISNTPYHSENYIEFVTVTIATCELLKTISSSLSKEESLGKYCEEWREVFAADAYYFLCKSWKSITETALKQGVNYKIYLHIVQLSETISCLCDMKTFHKLKPINGNVEEWVQFTMTCILTPSVPVQITSYKILQVLLPDLMKMDEELNESSLNKISCNFLETKLIETQTVFNTMLQDFSIGVSCSVAPFTDSYTYSLAYLLLWSVLIKMCKEGDAQQKYIYPLWIKEKDIIPNFIEGVVKLMPESVIYFQEKNIIKGRDFFAVPPSHTFYDWTSEKLSHLSCWLMTELMATLPAVVRQWASEAEPKQLAFVDRLVTAFISPNLASREMFAINKQQKTFDNMKVYTHPSVREVVAVYTVEESSTELVVQLANNHPLSPPKVDISKAMISSMQTRQWLKQLTIFLTHQNGSIWDGLVLWKSNLDKKFEGIDECYICFSILHNTTHQLPKLSCHTCKKKFHSYCLYKWFSTSHKSTCPICRAIF